MVAHNWNAVNVFEPMNRKTDENNNYRGCSQIINQRWPDTGLIRLFVFRRWENSTERGKHNNQLRIMYNIPRLTALGGSYFPYVASTIRVKICLHSALRSLDHYYSSSTVTGPVLHRLTHTGGKKIKFDCHTWSMVTF